MLSHFILQEPKQISPLVPEEEAAEGVWWSAVCASSLAYQSLGWPGPPDSRLRSQQQTETCVHPLPVFSCPQALLSPGGRTGGGWLLGNQLSPGFRCWLSTSQSWSWEWMSLGSYISGVWKSGAEKRESIGPAGSGARALALHLGHRCPSPSEGGTRVTSVPIHLSTGRPQVGWEGILFLHQVTNLRFVHHSMHEIFQYSQSLLLFTPLWAPWNMVGRKGTEISAPHAGT
uniref:Uncharacterized protein n=1 Tax=Myotis myotis TaxID=51298 RepID=A0A7J7XZR4_MYOMY|nr:hypothetical protein mMyoMyo1_011328 [Myotis myotis]